MEHETELGLAAVIYTGSMRGDQGERRAFENGRLRVAELRITVAAGPCYCKPDLTCASHCHCRRWVRCEAGNLESESESDSSRVHMSACSNGSEARRRRTDVYGVDVHSACMPEICSEKLIVVCWSCRIHVYLTNPVMAKRTYDDVVGDGAAESVSKKLKKEKKLKKSGDDAEEVSKAERKALRRARKEQEKLEAAQSASASAVDEDASEKAEKKARRRAERRRAKQRKLQDSRLMARLTPAGPSLLHLDRLLYETWRIQSMRV